jgi:hypothetical protein
MITFFQGGVMGIGSGLISERNIFRPVFAIFFILSILMTQGNGFAYQQPGPSTGGGVVRNGAKGKWDDDPRIKLTFLEMLGQEDDENYMFHKPKAIASDRKGNLYVLDSGNFRVQVFDGHRKFLRSFGRKGQGPGDLGRPECLDVDAAGNVYVGDPGNGRIAIFDPAGKWLRAILIPSANIGFRVMNNGDILLRNPNLENGNGFKKGHVPLIRILDGGGKLKREIGQGFYFTEFPEATGGNRALMTKDEDDNAYLAFLFQNRICKYSPEGDPIYSADRALPKDRKTKSSLGVELYYTINDALDVDSQGRAWVVTYTRMWGKGDPIIGPWTDRKEKLIIDRTRTTTDLYEIQVFDKAGILLQKIPLNHFCNDLKVVGDTVYILDQDRLGQFYVYRIEEAPPSGQ